MHAARPALAVHHRSTAWPALFDPLARCRCSEVDDPYLEYAPKQFYIKMLFPNYLSGRTTSRQVAGNPRARPFAVAGEWGYSPLRCQQGECTSSPGTSKHTSDLASSGRPAAT